MSPNGTWSLATVSDADVEAGLFRLLRAHARTEARIVAHLAEVEGRRLHLQAGYGSMFEYCLEHLGLGDFEAFLRITAARLAVTFPMILDLLENGEIHLTAIRLLRHHLTDENHRELLAEAVGKSKRQIETLLARRFPRPDVPERLRKLPVLEPLSPGRFRLELTIDEALKDKLELARDLLSHANPSRDWATVINRGADALLTQLQRRKFGKTRRSTREQPGLEAQATARELEADEQAGDRSRQPRSALAPALGEAGRGARWPAPAPATDAAASECKTSAEPEAQPPAPINSVRRRVPSELRRRIVARDGLCCAYVGSDGRRCTSRSFLELHHVTPWAKGGGETLENLRLFCKPHNRLEAEQEFGQTSVAVSIATRRAETLPRQPGQSESRPKGAMAPTAPRAGGAACAVLPRRSA